MRQAWRASVVCGHAWSEFDVRSPSFVKKNLQGTWTAEFMSGLSGRTFRVSGLFQTGHFPGFPFVPSRTPDWYKPSLSSELKFRLRPTLKYVHPHHQYLIPGRAQALRFCGAEEGLRPPKDLKVLTGPRITHVWLSQLKYRIRVGFICFELDPGGHSP